MVSVIGWTAIEVRGAQKPRSKRVKDESRYHCTLSNDFSMHAFPPPPHASTPSQHRPAAPINPPTTPQPISSKKAPSPNAITKPLTVVPEVKKAAAELERDSDQLAMLSETSSRKTRVELSGMVEN